VVELRPVLRRKLCGSDAVCCLPGEFMKPDPVDPVPGDELCPFHSLLLVDERVMAADVYPPEFNGRSVFKIIILAVEPEESMFPRGLVEPAAHVGDVACPGVGGVKHKPFSILRRNTDRQ